MTYPSDLAMTQLSTLKLYLDPSPQNGIASVAITAAGTGYTSATGTIVDSTGTGASLGPAAISAGGVITFPIVSRGQNYLNPTLVITGDGTGAAGTVSIGADAVLSGLITRASAMLLQLTNRQAIFDSGSNITEKRSGNGKCSISVKVDPIISVSSVTIGTSPALSASDGTTTGFVFDETEILLIGTAFTRGAQNVTLVYRGGVVTGSSVAAMLEQACLVTCSLWWKRRPHLEYMSESVNQGLGTHSFVQSDIPKEAATIVQQIQRVAPFL